MQKIPKLSTIEWANSENVVSCGVLLCWRIRWPIDFHSFQTFWVIGRGVLSLCLTKQQTTIDFSSMGAWKAVNGCIGKRMQHTLHKFFTWLNWFFCIKEKSLEHFLSSFPGSLPTKRHTLLSRYKKWIALQIPRN